jgi:quercetin dioxygenase-like cupin family protein
MDSHSTLKALEPDRMPWLHDPVISVDLFKELAELRKADSWSRETGRSSKTLAKFSDFRIVLIAMKAGSRMEQHRAEGRVSIQQVLGTCRIHLADSELVLAPGSLIVLDAGVLHDVEANEESALLLTIAWSQVPLASGGS